MASEQVRNVLRCTRGIHERAAIFFTHLAKRCQQERARMLLDYLAGHERHLADAILETEAGAGDKILGTWVTTTKPVAHLVDQMDWDEAHNEGASFDELVETGLEIANRVIEVYDDLARRAEPAWVQEIFFQLLDMEQQEEKLMAKQTLRAMDL
ncbi:hypothetical protein [Aeoliella sp.]|uniref:hypothetical protein n=1 Tax=Aeoliella sp. TaxID=2795800 RepID=UPI003CCBC9A4